MAEWQIKESSDNCEFKFKPLNDIPHKCGLLDTEGNELCQQSTCPKRIDTTDVVCPYCHEGGFDLIGLKGHLIHDCIPYYETIPPVRIFK